MSPSFQAIFELLTSTHSTHASPRNPEYPSAAFISPALALVSDGHGLMYVLRLADSGPAEAIGIFVLPETSSGSPFRIHSIHRPSLTTATAILSSRYYGTKLEVEPQPPGRRTSTPTEFDIWGVKIDLPAELHNDIKQLDVLWHRRGQSVPIYTTYLKSIKSSLLIGGTGYHEVGYIPAPSYEPSPDEIVPIPRTDENLRVDPVKPPSYSWTQTSDSVTIAIPLPSNTPKSAIKITFSPKSLTFHVDSKVPMSVSIPQYSSKSLWGGISASSSYWTWDREGERSLGLLTLYLDKQHEGTKWPQVFTSTSDPLDEEVLETLDPSELWHVREELEKYTTALRDGEDVSGLGLGRGLPSLAEGELDIEVDETVGRTGYLSWVDDNGSIPSWYGKAEDIPFQLLSTPIPGLDDMSLVIKSNIDGTVFTSMTPNDSPIWTHTSTFPALSFVLASKQDTRFTFHTSKAVLAFEGGSRDRGGNVYIYRSASPGAKWAKQSILKVSDSNSGFLLGVGAIKINQSISLIVCLTEGELVVIKEL